MRIAIAQVNPCVGDIEGNTSLVLEQARIARESHGAGAIVFPELMLTGYPPEDLLLRPALYRQLDAAMERLKGASTGIKLIVGCPRLAGGDLYNSCAVIEDGAVTAWYDKMELPNYGVFDEKRYFKAGTSPCLIDLDGVPAALSICEDVWSPAPAKLAREAGAELLININASPFHDRKITERREALSARHRETGLPIIYLNAVGGQDELVFDGGSMVLGAAGVLVYEAPEFEAGLHVFEIRHGDDGGARILAPAHAPARTGREETVYGALVLGVRDYVRKNGFQSVVIGLSGGIDSAVVTCVAADALGPENVEGVLMPSRYTADISVEDSVRLAANLGIRHHVVSIERPFEAFNGVLEPLFEGLPADTAEENIQARCRGVILMAVSNKFGRMVLTTGNKSEMAVGYATLYGDMVGAYAPLKDVSKLLVYELARWRNTRSPDIPPRIIERPPSAELRADQKDADSLPPYEILDPILERYIERDQTPREIVAAGYDAATVYKVTRLVDLNEYKRRQAAPGVKISKRAFGRERRYPITSRYKEE